MTEQQYLGRKRHIISNITEGKIDNRSACLSDKCIKCKGNCCKKYPCIMSPREFIDIDNMDYMKSVLDTGVLSLASFNMSDSYYIVRARGINDPETVATRYIEGPNSCILQGKKGCVLEYITRPTEGLLLIPEKNSNRCNQEYDDAKIINDWYRYQSILRDLYIFYKDKVILKPTADPETADNYKQKLLKLDVKKGAK